MVEFFDVDVLFSYYYTFWWLNELFVVKIEFIYFRSNIILKKMIVYEYLLCSSHLCYVVALQSKSMRPRGR